MSAASAQLFLAEGLARQNRVAEAVEACYEVLRLDDSEPLAHALLADLLLAGDFYEEAIGAAALAIELDVDCTPAYLALGLAYDRRGGMWDRSVLVWHELAEVAPELVTAHVQLGEALAASAFEEEAIAAWRKALELDPRQARAMYDLAVAALKREGMATALPGFRKAGELDPSQDDFFFGLAGVGSGGDEVPRAEDVEPDRFSRLAAAYSLARADDLFGAADMIRLLLSDKPDDAEALALAGFLYLKQEASNEAMAVALRALAIDPKTPTAVYVLGSSFTRRRGLGKSASRVFGALAKAVPDQPMSHVLHAEALLGVQRYADAKVSYLRAVQLDPTLVRARFGLAAVLLTEGEHALAAHEITRAAYYDTRREGLFMCLYEDYARGREQSAE